MEKLTKKLKEIMVDKAYIFGILHDIGRRVGIVNIPKHVYEGYKYSLEKGWDEVAKICMTHSYPLMKKEIKGEKMDIEFRKITEFPRGTLATLLKDGYSFEPIFERDWHKQWQEFDDFFYDNPHIAEFSGFMTVLNGKPIGFVSWNPTNLPESSEVGHNCILTKYKGNGYGKRQMREAVQRMIAQGAKKIVVWTNEIIHYEIVVR